MMCDVVGFVKLYMRYTYTMKLGIKLGPQKENFDRLAQTNAPFAEVWFNANAPHLYTDLFGELKARTCDVGLHFWGSLPGDISPNLAYPDRELIDGTKALMRSCIDIAAQNGFQYVNIHPGSQAKTRVDYKKETYTLLSEPVELETATELFLEHAKALHEYAKSCGIVFTVETVPIRIHQSWYDQETRKDAQNIFELPVSSIRRAAQSGLSIANDFCHTASNIITDNPHAVYTFLQGTTAALAANTRLIHLGFVVPPYNGTDHHDTLANPLLNSDDAVPNKQQMIDLLKLFQNRDDVWILVEPKDDHVENYFLAQKILQQAGI